NPRMLPDGGTDGGNATHESEPNGTSITLSVDMKLRTKRHLSRSVIIISAEWKETEHVLSYSDPMGGRSTQSTAELAVEINGPQFTAGPVSNASALWPSAARSSACLFLLITGESGGAARAREQRTQ